MCRQVLIPREYPWQDGKQVQEFDGFSEHSGGGGNVATSMPRQHRQRAGYHNRLAMGGGGVKTGLTEVLHALEGHKAEGEVDRKPQQAGHQEGVLLLAGLAGLVLGLVHVFCLCKHPRESFRVAEA